MSEVEARPAAEAAKPDVKKGLVGVYADVTAVSKVMPETNSLTYRGYAMCSFEGKPTRRSARAGWAVAARATGRFCGRASAGAAHCTHAPFLACPSAT